MDLIKRNVVNKNRKLYRAKRLIYFFFKSLDHDYQFVMYKEKIVLKTSDYVLTIKNDRSVEVKYTSFLSIVTPSFSNPYKTRIEKLLNSKRFSRMIKFWAKCSIALT